MHMFAAFYFIIVLSLEQEWKFSYDELISLWTLGALLIGLGALPAGWLSDKWSRSSMMVIMFIGMGLSSILCGLSNEKFLLFISLSFLGLSCSIYHPVGIAWVVNATNKKGKALGINGIFGGIGIGSGAFIAGLLIKYFDWKESDKIKANKKNYPLILTTSRVLQHYNAATMTRRTKNINIVDEDILLVHPKDAKHRKLNTGDVARLYSGRGEVSLKVEVTDKVKEGIVFTTFHFPEHMVNMVTGHGKDEETMCAEYKVSSVEVQKISNKFKTEVVVEKNQAEVTSQN